MLKQENMPKGSRWGDQPSRKETLVFLLPFIGFQWVVLLAFKLCVACLCSLPITD